MCGFAGIQGFQIPSAAVAFLELRCSLLEPRRAVSLCIIPSLSLGTVMTAALAIGGMVRDLLQDGGHLVAIAALISSNITRKSDEEE